jgi:hypothetical protein
MLVKIAEFDPMSLSFEQVTVSSNVPVILPKVHDGEQCPLLQLPTVKLSCYGIPRKSKYFLTDKDRMFIQLPLQGELLEQFKAIDTVMSTEELRTELFGFSTGLSYQYCPLVKSGNKGEYVKLKLDTNHVSGAIETMLTVDGDTAHAATLPQFEYKVVYNSKIKMIVKLVKVWTMNKRFGLTIKAIKVDVKQPEQLKEVEVNFLD